MTGGKTSNSTLNGKNMVETNGLCLRGERQYSRQELIAQAGSFMQLIPRVSVVLFYWALLSIISVFLGKLKLYPDFILVLTGRTGSFKTTLARMTVFVLEKESEQEMKFCRTSSLNQVEERLKRLDGRNLLIDDIFPAQSQYQRDKQADLLNNLSRLGDRRQYKSGIVITAEKVPEQLILSGWERVLEVSVPSMDSETKQDVWDRLQMIPDDFMAAISEAFEHILIEHSDAVIDDIKLFLQQYKFPYGLNLDTRIGIHVKYLELTEFLYRQHFCDGDEVSSMTGKFKEALHATAIRQHKDICKTSLEEDMDYVWEVYKMMTSKDKYLKMEGDFDNYEPDGKNFLIRDGKYYITFDALRYGMQMYLNRPANVREISRLLFDAGVMETDASGARSKKCGLRVRHYVILCSEIQAYCIKAEERKNT